MSSSGSPNSIRRSRRSTALILSVLGSTGTVVSLQATIVVPLLPEFPRLLTSSSSSASWLVTATLLAGAVATPIVARLADLYGKKRMMLFALAVMVIGSVVGALVQPLALLVAARALQGVGLALIPVGIAIMRDELPSERVPLGVALMSATMAIGAGAGLPLCGLMVEYLNWHSIFWLMGIAGTLSAIAVAFVLEESSIRTRSAFDLRGALLLSVALTSILLALSKGAHWGWSSPRTLALGVVGLLLLAVWIPFELRTPNPLVDMRVAARPIVLLVNATSFLTGCAMYTNMLVSTQLLQLPTSTGFGLGLSVTSAGLAMVPSALSFGITAPISAWAIRRFGPPATLLAGTLGMAGVYFVRVFTSSDLWQVILGSMLIAGTTSLAFAAMPTIIMRSVPVTETASANGLNTLLRSMGTSASSATAAAMTSIGVSNSVDGHYPTFNSLLWLFWISGLLALGAYLLTVPLCRIRHDVGDLPDSRAAVDGTAMRGIVAS